MSGTDDTTAGFAEAAKDFADAAERVYGLRLGEFQLRIDLDAADSAVREFERRVSGSPVVQQPPADGGPHNAETRMARTVEILAGNSEYLGLMSKAAALRADVAQNEAELERWRDARSLARRRMDYAVAIAAAGKEDRDA